MIQAAIDVTNRVLARQQGERNQRQVLSFFEQSPVGLATCSADQELTVQWANPFFGVMFGHPLQAIVGKSLLEALPELKGQSFDEIIKNVIQTGSSG